MFAEYGESSDVSPIVLYLSYHFNGGFWERNWTRTSGKEYPRIIPETNIL